MSEMGENIAGDANAAGPDVSGDVGGEPTMRDKIEAALRTVFDPEIPVEDDRFQSADRVIFPFIGKACEIMGPYQVFGCKVDDF